MGFVGLKEREETNKFWLKFIKGKTDKDIKKILDSIKKEGD